MKVTLRQSMAWLHTWSGLLAGWLLLAVCLTGTAAYYRDELSLWMQPELHVAAAHPVSQAEAAALAVRALQQRGPRADRWVIDLPDERRPLIGISWSSVGGRPAAPAAGRPPGNFERETLDAATGQAVPGARETRGGGFFYSFHFTLHYLPVRWGRWIVSACAMLMLVTVVSGVVTHRRFFADFFTFRPGKGQRSWLDAHNVLAVLALPFHLVITYSGLITLMFLAMPWSLDAVYGSERNRFFADTLPQAPALMAASGVAAPLADLPTLLARATRHWGGAQAARITVLRPNDANARVVITRHDAGRLSNVQQAVHFDGVGGVLLATAGDAPTPIGQTRGVLYGLHLGRFADAPLRAVFFLCGLAASAMIATGLLLWAVKARQRQAKALAAGGRASLGLRLVDGLNVATVAGLPVAMASMLWANRLLPPDLPGRASAEVNVFFAVWATLAVLALAWPTRRAWLWQLGLGVVALAGLPLLNLATAPAGLASGSLLAGGTGLVAGVDLAMLGLAAVPGAMWWHLLRRGPGVAPVRPAAGVAQ